jgi:5-methylcytosine-specific restriction enzyme subunit McrC
VSDQPDRVDGGLGGLREGQCLDGVELTRAEAAALNASGLVSVEPRKAGWLVTAGSTIGLVRCGELIVRVQPEAGVPQVLRLLARAYGLAPLPLDDGLLDDGLLDVDLPTALAALFAREASAALASGPSRRYRTEEQTLPVLRGRVRVRDQQLRRFGLPLPLEVTVDEWTTDTDANRRLRAAARRLLLLPGLPRSAADRLRRVDRVLADVPLTRPPPATRSRLADLVLALRPVEYRVGPIEVSGGTLCLATLFERLVTRMLTEAATGFGVSGRRSFGLDTAGRLAMWPDLVVTAGGRIVAVADARYRPLDDRGRLPRPDAYRLLAYCARLSLDTGHLIYATDFRAADSRAPASRAADLWANEEPRPEPYDIVGAGIRLVLHGVDLRQPVADLERSVHKVFLKLVRLQPTSAIA